jgi:NADH:ubiquinone oxidoreductase subunit F (NADH-binding)
MDVEVGEGHGRHLCGEETQVVVDHIEVFEHL